MKLPAALLAAALLPLPGAPTPADTQAPTTTILTTRPAPADGWLRSTTIVIEFRGEHTGGTGPIRYECQLHDTPATPATWAPCTTPRRYDGLREDGATPYTFRVRAVDATTGTADETPAELDFRVDATAPDTRGTLRHVSARKVRVSLRTAPGDDPAARFGCRLDGRRVGCARGRAVLRVPEPGRHRFTATAVDAAGNVDRTPFTRRFVVRRVI